MQCHKKCLLNFFTILFYLIGGDRSLSANERILSTHIVGGLGNQLFMVAAAIAVSSDYGYQLTLPKITKADSFFEPRPVYWDTVFHKFPTHPPNLNLNLITHEDPSCLYYTKIIPVHDRIILAGYFPSAKYFDHHRDKILELFQLPDALQAVVEQKYQEIIHAENEDTVSIHVRLDDTFKFHPINGVIDFWREPYNSYYDQAIALFPGDVTFVVFSDNCSWTREFMKEKLKGRRAVYVCNQDYIDLFLMARCKHNILVNSTYSWWGSYLNRNPDKIVVSPKYWQKRENTPCRADVLMSNWVLIDNIYD